MLEILKSNKGFKQPELWIDYAARHNFRPVHATKLEGCPDCDSSRSESIGQYIYYSTLVELRSCLNCGLLYSDTKFDPGVLYGHFEQAYKDEEYFALQRKEIFSQLTAIIERSSPHGAKVLDIGGAKGHLLAMVKQRRPDLHLVLNDVSMAACEYAEMHYRLDVVCGAVETLERLPERFDTVVLSDVMYYEPEIRRLWTLLSRIVAPTDAIIIRVPNHFALIKFAGALGKLFSGQMSRKMNDTIRFYNPEHLYVFSRKYLSRRLGQIGFPVVNTVPSALLQKGNSSLYHLYYTLAQAIFSSTLKHTIVTPSMIIIAKRQP